MSLSQQKSDIPMGPNLTNPDDYYYEESPSPIYHIENHRSPLRRTRSTHGRVEGHVLVNEEPPDNDQVGSDRRRSPIQHELSSPIYQVSQHVAHANSNTLPSTQIKTSSRPQRSQPIITNGHTLRSVQNTNSSQPQKTQYLTKAEKLDPLLSSQHLTRPQLIQDAIQPQPGRSETISIRMHHVNRSSLSFSGNAQRSSYYQDPQSRLTDPKFGFVNSTQWQASSSGSRGVYEFGFQWSQLTRTPLRWYEPGSGPMYPSIQPTVQNNGSSSANPPLTALSTTCHSRRMNNIASSQQVQVPSTMISLLYGPALQEGCPTAAAREVRIPLESLYKYVPSQDMRELAYEILRKHIPMEREWTKGAISRLETEAFCQWGTRDGLSTPQAPQYWTQRVMQQVLIREWPYWYFNAELVEREQYKGRTRMFADSLKYFRLHRERRQTAKLQRTRGTQDKEIDRTTPVPYAEVPRKHIDGDPQGNQATEHPDNTEVNLVDRTETFEGQERQTEEYLSSEESQVKKSSSSEESVTQATTPIIDSQPVNTSPLSKVTKDWRADFWQKHDVNTALIDAQPINGLSFLPAQQHTSLLERLRTEQRPKNSQQPLTNDPDITASVFRDLLDRINPSEAEQAPRNLVADMQEVDRRSSNTEEPEKLPCLHEDQQLVLEAVEDREKTLTQEDSDAPAEVAKASEKLSSTAAMSINAEAGQTYAGPSEDKPKRKQGKKGKKSQWRHLAIDYPLPPTPL